ncbi:MAG: two-component system, OmpR family, response regulator [Actinomycetota bacterium]|jgi:two-component system OmpR family response regulator|nr:two-component system, OmpR family, response regulator [Actinomycetota bacterium]
MRVLVVEDEIKMARLLERGLGEEGYAVDVAGDGAEALWLAVENPYDIILLDLMLPDTDGVETCRQLRERGIWAPVMMVTARDGIDDHVKGLDVGADDYITKPFSFAELLARIRALLRRPALERPSILLVGDLKLDPATRQVWRGTAEVEVTTKEFALLEYFMRNPEQVLSRSRLIEHVWDFAYDGDSNVVDVYVRYLREKIDRPFGKDSLQTVRGAGYRLHEEIEDALPD